MSDNAPVHDALPREVEAEAAIRRLVECGQLCEPIDSGYGPHHDGNTLRTYIAALEVQNAALRVEAAATRTETARMAEVKARVISIYHERINEDSAELHRLRGQLAALTAERDALRGSRLYAISPDGSVRLADEEGIATRAMVKALEWSKEVWISAPYTGGTEDFRNGWLQGAAAVQQALTKRADDEIARLQARGQS